MDNEQHAVQDSAELYAVYVMQRTAEDRGIAERRCSHARREEFLTYLSRCGLTSADFERGIFAKYKTNVDLQIPNFVKRLESHYNGCTIGFENVEAAMRNAGRKADFLIHVSGLAQPVAVSLKNYIGGGGIKRPQVSSGTFLSFAASFVFARVGVGVYEDPRPDKLVFRGQDSSDRDAVLAYMGRTDLKAPLDVLERLQSEMRVDLLGPDCEYYDRARVRAAVERAADPGITTVLTIFRLLGLHAVRDKFLARVGLDGHEESLFFDGERYVDSITNPAYHDFRERINAPGTEFAVAQHRQSVRFSFADDTGAPLLTTDVPFTINTNGAWFRPRPRYAGLRTYNDKGHEVALRWGQRRPYKSREIATSTNTYIDLARVGIFGT